MKRLLSALVAMSICAAMAMAAAEADTTVKGVVKVTKEGDQVTKIEIVAKEKDAEGNEVEKAYVVAGDKATEVANLDGKRVEVKGTVEEKDGVAVITVKAVKEVKAAKEVKVKENTE